MCICIHIYVYEYVCIHILVNIYTFFSTYIRMQVVTPAMANKLVLNHGAIFMKFSFKKGSVGVRSKSERLVWLSGLCLCVFWYVCVCLCVCI